jgi:hypothetical protein
MDVQKSNEGKDMVAFQVDAFGVVRVPYLRIARREALYVVVLNDAIIGQRIH